jgi:hypothetical protein
MDLPPGAARLADVREGVLLEVAPVHRQLEDTVDAAQVLIDRTGSVAGVTPRLNELLTVTMVDVAHVDVSNGLDQMPHGDILLGKCRLAHLARGFSQMVFEHPVQPHWLSPTGQALLQIALNLITFTLGPLFLGMTEGHSPTNAVFVSVIQHIHKPSAITGPTGS